MSKPVLVMSSIRWPNCNRSENAQALQGKAGVRLLLQGSALAINLIFTKTVRRQKLCIKLSIYQQTSRWS
jgi:hypothetical protein